MPIKSMPSKGTIILHENALSDRGSSRIALLLAPPFLVLTIYLAFRYAAAWLGLAQGYLVSFLFYWIFWCFLLSAQTVFGEGG